METRFAVRRIDIFLMWGIVCAAALVAVLGAHSQLSTARLRLAGLHAPAAQARAAGEFTVRLAPKARGQQPVTLSLKDALPAYDLVLLQPLSAETVVENGRSILTWYKVRILSELSTSKPSLLAPALADLPPDIFPRDLPSTAEELLLIYHGGTIKVDGVTLIEESENFPPLTVSSRYLAFLNTSRDGAVALIPLGGSGIFEVDEAGRLRPLGSDPHPLVADIQQSFHNSLSEIPVEARK